MLLNVKNISGSNLTFGTVVIVPTATVNVPYSFIEEVQDSFSKGKCSFYETYTDEVAPATGPVSLINGQLVAGGSIVAVSEVTPYVTRTGPTAGIAAFTGACEFAGFDCTVAAGTITIYDSLSASGNVIVHTTALTLGRTEFQWKRALTVGCHVVLSGAATVNLLVG